MKMSTSTIIFECWLNEIFTNNDNKKWNVFLWRKKYFILMRHFGKPEIRLYSKKPKSLEEKHKKILIEDGYQIFKLSSYKGKYLVCHLVQKSGSVYLAPLEGHVCEFIYFFLMTLSKLGTNATGCPSFIVRPEKSEDSQRIGCVNSICILVLSRWGITCALQVSGSIVGHWPLRCIKSFECSGRGCFTLEVGPFAPSGPVRLSLRTKFGQDVAIYDLLDELIEETKRLESIMLDKSGDVHSRERLLGRAFREELRGLCSIGEVSSDQTFDSHLKKLSRDIYDHLGSHFGENALYVNQGEAKNVQAAPILSKPPTLWSNHMSVTSDDVFRLEETTSPPRNFPKNYMDMTKLRTDSSNSHAEPYLSPRTTWEETGSGDKEYINTSASIPLDDFGCYIHSDKHSDKQKKVAASTKGKYKGFFNKKRISTRSDGLEESSFDEHSNSNDPSGDDQLMDYIVEQGDETYLANNFNHVEANQVGIPFKSLKTFKKGFIDSFLDVKKAKSESKDINCRL